MDIKNCYLKKHYICSSKYFWCLRNKENTAEFHNTIIRIFLFGKRQTENMTIYMVITGAVIDNHVIYGQYLITLILKEMLLFVITFTYMSNNMT